MKTIILKTKNKSFEVTEEELESVLVDEWYLSCLYKYQETVEDKKVINIDEEYKIFKDIYDSFKFRTLIISDVHKIKYYQKLGEKWCFPQWLLLEIENKIFEIDQFKQIKKHILEIHICVNCKQGFKITENHEDACHFHTGILYDQHFKCCGHYNKPGETLEYYCKKGYHVADKKLALENIKKYTDIFSDSLSK